MLRAEVPIQLGSRLVVQGNSEEKSYDELG